MGQGHTGEKAREAAQVQDIELQIVTLPEAKKGFVLMPERWVVENTNGTALALQTTLTGL